MNRLLAKALSGIVKLYQLTIGTVFGGQCRYYPSCSEYSRQAFVKYGAARGAAKSAWRLLRCNPFSRGGADPA